MEGLTIQDVRPFLRFAQKIAFEKGSGFSDIVARDFRIFYVAEGEGSLTVENETYRLYEGCIVLFPPAKVYTVAALGESGMTIYGLNFDMTGAHRDESTPVPPLVKSAFTETRALAPFVFKEPSLLNEPVYRTDRKDLEPRCAEILLEYEQKLIYCEERISALLLSLITLLLRCDEGRNTSPRERLLSFISEHYGEVLTNAEIGAALGYHPNHLNRLSLLYTGMSLHKYLQTYRISKATDLLSQTELSVEEISARIGFADLAHFSKCFKRHTGYTPSAFRAGHRAKRLKM